MQDKEDEDELKMAYGHLCYECHLAIKTSELVTLTHAGPLPIYHHAVCFHGEKKTQEIAAYGIKTNGAIYREVIE